MDDHGGYPHFRKPPHIPKKLRTALPCLEDVDFPHESYRRPAFCGSWRQRPALQLTLQRLKDPGVAEEDLRCHEIRMVDLLVLNAGNGWEWGLLWLAGMFIHIYSGSFPHSLRLAPVSFSTQTWDLPWGKIDVNNS